MDKIVLFIENLIKESRMNTKIDRSTSLFLSGILDSVAGLKLIMFLEKEYNFDAATIDFDINKLDSIELISQYTGSKP